MKAPWLALAIASAPIARAAGQQAQSNAPVPSPRGQEILDVEHVWDAANKAHDVNRVARILALEWSMISPYGSVISRDAMLAWVRTNRVDSTTFADLRIQVFDTIAVATGRGDEFGTLDDGKPYSEHYRWLDVFVYRDGRWQAIVSQATFIAPP